MYALPVCKFMHPTIDNRQSTIDNHLMQLFMVALVLRDRPESVIVVEAGEEVCKSSSSRSISSIISSSL